MWSTDWRTEVEEQPRSLMGWKVAGRGKGERRGPWSFLSNAHCLVHEGPAYCELS